MRVCGKNVFNELDKTKIKKVYLSKNFHDEKIIESLKEHHLKYVLTEYKTLDAIGDEKFVLILDHLEDPHNFGAIIRSCEARGIKNIIIPKDRSVSVTDAVMKTSTGAIENVNIIMVNNLVAAINKLKDKGFFVYAAEADGEDYRKVDYADKICLVIGSEGFGLTKIVRQNSDVIISIPMKGHVNSLNASVSAGILLFGIGN